jgi:hypothetical protein
VIDEVRRSLRHVPAVAGRAHAPTLARKRDDELLRALCAKGAGESETEQSARQIPAKLLFGRGRCTARPGSGALEPAGNRCRRGTGLSFLHRFGSALNHHMHLHACVTDGVFLPADGDMLGGRSTE